MVPPQRLKLLFADDERSLQEFMSVELPRLGHEVTVCPDGLTALAALERNTYDCILVDLDMPGLNGIEVITKAKELSPATDAVILTGKSSLGTAVAALRQGVFDYLKAHRLADPQIMLSQGRRKARTNERSTWPSNGNSNGSGSRTWSAPRHAKVRQLIARVAPTVRPSWSSAKPAPAGTGRAGHSFKACGPPGRSFVSATAPPESLIERIVRTARRLPGASQRIG